MKEAIPLLDLTRQFNNHEEELSEAVMRVCRTQGFILGPEVQKLEELVASYCGVDYGVGVSSGTDALIVALLAAGIGKGDEVITSPFSFFASASSIARVGATPVFVDIDPLTFTLNPDNLERAITTKTKAIIPVHIFGQCTNMSRVSEIAKANDLFVIEDAAQAIGASFQGKKTGALGDMGCFSFFPSKNLGCFGDGGMVVTQNEETANTLRSLRMHGSSKAYIHDDLGGNFRLDALQAAVLSVKLQYLDNWSAARVNNAKKYRDLFVEAGLTVETTKVDGLDAYPIVLPYEDSKCGHVYNQFVVRVRERDKLRSYLNDNKIGNQVYYPLGLHMQPCFAHLGYKEEDFIECYKATKEVLALPIFPELEDREIRRVVEVIKSFYQREV